MANSLHTITSQHHLVPRSMGGLNNPINVRKIQDKFHRNFHRVFENKTPKGQIEMILDINSPVIERKIRHAIQDIIENEDTMYKDGVWIYK